jgi:O-methyltransferase
MVLHMKALLGRIISSSLIISSIYYKLLKPHQFAAFKNYKFSDEKLKFMHLMEAVNYCRIALLPHVYFEFGCHSARTFSSVINSANYLKMDKMEFYAFDSFEGLPSVDSEQDGIFKTGEFATAINDFKSKVLDKTGYKLSDKFLIKGFYSNSLTSEVQKRMPKVGVVHIDVDLYSSTIEVLNFLKPLLVVGTVILFDDYYCFPPDSKHGEMKALMEFSKNNPNFQFKEWKAYSTFGQSFFVSQC